MKLTNALDPGIKSWFSELVELTVELAKLISFTNESNKENGVVGEIK